MLSKIEYPFGGSLKYQIPFPYVNEADIIVTVGNVVGGFNFISKGNIVLDESPVSGDIVQIKRKTDISNIAHLYASGEIFDKDTVNKIKLQLIYALQEASETELDSLESAEDGTLFLNFDMNNNQIRNLMEADSNLDAFTLGQALDLLGLIPNAGFNIGDTIISARADQQVEKVDFVNKWILRDVDRQEFKSDYPELATMYPETPGGVVGFPLELTSIGVEKGHYNSVRNSIYKPRGTTGNYKLYENETEVFNLSANIIPTTEQRTTVYSEGNFGILTYGSQFIYTTDNFQTWNDCIINGTPPAFRTSTYEPIIHFLNGKYITFKCSSSGNNLYMFYSDDGVTWDFNSLSSMGYVKAASGDYYWSSKCVNYDPVENVYYFIQGFLHTAEKSCVLKISSDLSTLLEQTNIPFLPSGGTRTATINYKGKVCFYNSSTNSYGFSQDYGISYIYRNESYISSKVGESISLFYDNEFSNSFFYNNEVLMIVAKSNVDAKTIILKVENNFTEFNIIQRLDNDLNISYIEHRYEGDIKDIPNSKNKVLFKTGGTTSSELYLHEFEIGSNLTFDMPAISPPSEGSGGLESLSILKQADIPIDGDYGFDYNTINNSVYQVGFANNNYSRLYKDGNLIYSISEATSVRANVYSEGNFGILNVANEGMYYTTDDFATLTLCTITSGPTSSNVAANTLAFVNNKYVTLFTGGTGTSLYLLISDDGITWDSLNLGSIGWSKGTSEAYPHLDSNLIEFKNGRYFFYPRYIASWGPGKIFSIAENLTDYQSQAITTPPVNYFYDNFNSDGVMLGAIQASNSLVISEDFGATSVSRNLNDIGADLGRTFLAISGYTVRNIYLSHDGEFIFFFDTSSETVFFKTDAALQNPVVVFAMLKPHNFTNLSSQYTRKDFRTKSISGQENTFILNSKLSDVFVMGKEIGSVTQHKHYTKGK